MLNRTKAEYAFEVHGAGQQEELAAIALDASVLHPHAAVVFLEDPKAPLHRTPYPRDKFIPLIPPLVKASAVHGLLHDAAEDTPSFKILPALLPITPLVCIDPLLITHDQFLKHLGVMDVGRGDLYLSYKLTVFIRTHMGLIAIVGLVLFYRPARIRVFGLLVGRGRPVVGPYKCGVYYYTSMPHHKALLFKLFVDVFKELLVKSIPYKLVPKPAYGGLVRHGVCHTEAKESLEGGPVSDCLLRLRVREFVPLLKKERLEYDARGGKLGLPILGS